MLSVLQYVWDWVIPFILVLSLLVFVHELGHYLVARLCRVRVEVFSIGFGTEIWGRYDRAGTRWKISAVPLGGYVKMYGENDFGDENDKPAMSAEDMAVSFHHKTLRQRAAIVAAGPLANFLLAIVLFAGIFGVIGIPMPLSAVGDTQADSVAAEAGFQTGDRIVRIDGTAVTWFEDVRRLVSDRPDQPTVFDVLRDDKEISLTATPRRTSVKGEDGTVRDVGLLGIKPDLGQVAYDRLGPLTAVMTAVERTASITAQILAALWEIITGSRTASELGGPLRIAQLSGEIAKDGAVNLIFFMAALSINLGLINLFPIPMLDGGHLAFYGAEAVLGRPVDRRIQEYCFRFGLAVVLMLVLFATWNDLVNLKVFDFVRQLIS